MLHDIILTILGRLVIERILRSVVMSTLGEWMSETCKKNCLGYTESRICSPAPDLVL